MINAIVDSTKPKDAIANDPNAKPEEPKLEDDGPMLPIYPVSGKGEKTVSCWNCLTILKVKDDWNIVECPVCCKINRIPNENITPSEARANMPPSYNNFDVKVPYIFGIITCPFCQTENRFRRDAQNIVCYKCHHSFSAEGNIDFSNNSFIKPAIPSLYGNNEVNNITVETRQSYTPTVRFSDYFYPDIMSYRGYYPQPYIIANNCGCNDTNLMIRDLIDEIKDSNKKRSRKTTRYIYTPGQSRISSLRSFVNDMEYIDDRRNFVYKYNNPSDNNGRYLRDSYNFTRDLSRSNQLSEKGTNLYKQFIGSQNYKWGDEGSTKVSSANYQSYGNNRYL